MNEKFQSKHFSIILNYIQSIVKFIRCAIKLCTLSKFSQNVKGICHFTMNLVKYLIHLLKKKKYFLNVDIKLHYLKKLHIFLIY